MMTFQLWVFMQLRQSSEKQSRMASRNDVHASYFFVPAEIGQIFVLIIV